MKPNKQRNTLSATLRTFASEERQGAKIRFYELEKLARRAARLEHNLRTMREYVSELEEKRNNVAVRNLSNMLYMEGVKNKMARLIAAGDEIAKLTPSSPAHARWAEAKNSQP